MAMNDDDELDRLREIKAARLRLGLDKPEAPGAKGAAPKVTVYSTQTCPYCVMAKQYLTARKIAYEDVDVGANQAAAMRMVQETGETGVPQIKIGGEWVLGFDRQKIDRLLGFGRN